MRSFEEAAKQAAERGWETYAQHSAGEVSSKGSQSICGRRVQGSGLWVPMDNSGSCLSNLRPGPLASLDETVRENGTKATPCCFPTLEYLPGKLLLWFKAQFSNCLLQEAFTDCHLSPWAFPPLPFKHQLYWTHTFHLLDPPGTRPSFPLACFLISPRVSGGGDCFSVVLRLTPAFAKNKGAQSICG